MGFHLQPQWSENAPAAHPCCCSGVPKPFVVGKSGWVSLCLLPEVTREWVSHSGTGVGVGGRGFFRGVSGRTINHSGTGVGVGGRGIFRSRIRKDNKPQRHRGEFMALPPAPWQPYPLYALCQALLCKGRRKVGGFLPLHPLGVPDYIFHPAAWLFLFFHPYPL